MSTRSFRSGERESEASARGRLTAARLARDQGQKGTGTMTRECPDHDDCMEVPLEVNVVAPGYPLVENLTGFAVSIENEAVLDFVGYEDAEGNRVELSTHEKDGFRRAAFDALMREASKPWVKAEFQDGFYAHYAGKRLYAEETARAFQAGA